MDVDVQRWAGWTALGGVALFSVANALWGFEQPPPGSSGARLVGFYTEASDRIVIGGLMSLCSLGVFAVFAAALRRVILAHPGSGLFADAAFAGALLGLAPGVGAETINAAAAMRAQDGELTEELALALFDVSYMLGSWGAALGFGVLVLAVSASALRGVPLLPRWFAFAGLAIGVALVTPLAGFLLGEYVIVAAAVVIVVAGVRLLQGRVGAPSAAAT